jgi:hypothetical protein
MIDHLYISLPEVSSVTLPNKIKGLMIIQEELWRGRECWILRTPELQAVVLKWGAQFAELFLSQKPSVNPLWIPPWTTIDPDRYEPGLHEAVYGGGSEARLLSGLAGHNICFPFWGDPSAAEHRAGMSFHGECNLVRWHLEDATAESITISGFFRESNLRMSRTIFLRGDRIEVASVAENLSAWDKPVAWCEHVTLGPTFLEAGKTEFQASATKGFKTGQESGEVFHWPQGRGDIDCDLSAFSRFQHRDLVNSFLINPSLNDAYFQVSHKDLGLQVTYRFPRKDFPWLNVWENHDARMLTRGMEFSNTPRHGTMKTLIQSTAVWDTPVYDWISARGTLGKTFVIFLKALG